jgi:DNA-binding PadR family transcriptional regulator
MPPDPLDFLPLSNLSFHVLLALGSGAAHGYAIGKDVETRSGGKLNPTTGGLYQALKRLADDGLIESARSADAQSPDTRRQHFKLTRLGRRVVAAEAARLYELVLEARQRNLYSGSV